MSADDDIRALERAAATGGVLERVALARALARRGEGPKWRAGDGRILSPHELETGHLVNVLKLKTRRFLGAVKGERVRRFDFEATAEGFERFAAAERGWLDELTAREAFFDPERYFRDRAEGWCELCPRGPWKRKKGVLARGPLLVFSCETCWLRRSEIEPGRSAGGSDVAQGA